MELLAVEALEVGPGVVLPVMLLLFRLASAVVLEAVRPVLAEALLVPEGHLLVVDSVVVEPAHLQRPVACLKHRVELALSRTPATTSLPSA